MTKVLVIEDEQLVRQLVSRLLTAEGYEVVEAPYGQAGYQMAISEKPNIILLDLMMPVMDGFQVLSKLKSNPETRRIPVIILTAKIDAESERRCMQSGAVDYIKKPWGPGEIVDRISMALGYPEDRSTQRQVEPILLGETAVKDASGGQAKAEESHRHNAEAAIATPYRRAPEGLGPSIAIGTAGRLVVLEKILGGGIPISTLTLVEGAAATGKSTLCQHLTYGALIDGHAAAYLTSEHTTQRFMAQMSSIGLDVSQCHSGAQLSILPLDEGKAGEDSSPRLTNLASDIEGLARDHELIIVDSITHIASHSRDQSIIDFFSTCKRLCSKAATIVVVIQPHVIDDNMLLRFHSICDNHVNLRSGNLSVKGMCTLRVLKANNVELSRNNSVSFQVEAEVGMRVLPLAIIRA